MSLLTQVDLLALAQEIAEIMAPNGSQNYNYALLDFGALVCRYGKPKCKVCPLNKSCDYYLSGDTAKDCCL